MADIAGALKTEIVRLSKKAVRQSIVTLQRASSSHRHDIASLKKQLATLERQVAALTRAGGKKQARLPEKDEATPHRFVAKGLRTHRSRLGLSQEEFGKLIGVSAQSVYNWEREAARPRPSQIAAIAAIRSMGKREARRRLEELAEG